MNSSYLWGDDEEWGPRYYFTYYSQFGDRARASTVEVMILAVSFVLAIAGNLGIAGCILRYKEMRTPTNLCLVNLAAADLLFSVGVPAIAYTRLTQAWRLGETICKLLPYSQLVCGFVLLWTLTFISMDRHRCLAVAPYRSALTRSRVLAASLLTWAIAASVFLPMIFWFKLKGLENGATGRRDSELSVVGTLLPWPGRKLSNASITARQGRAGSLSQHEEIRLQKHLRVVRMLMLNVLCVLIMWLPITTVILLIYVDGKRSTENPDFFLKSHHFIWALIVAQFNAIVNPVLYGIFSENFRICFAKLWRRSLDSNTNATAERRGSKKNSKTLVAFQSRLGGVRTPTSSRNLQKQSKKSSSCSIGSIVEVPATEKL
ncbi:free fatty acid receptor 4-like isoform X2 [Nomia melanderi]|uniref:free fatty acid receptor 4-like isoform X2 n=1 Tax=Nomia melanderi TaxID=2448451 RepID=UPI0013047334|nr:free fatty acid receptor 4-like isoform X2 [Nomia melanderi]